MVGLTRACAVFLLFAVSCNGDRSRGGPPGHLDSAEGGDGRAALQDIGSSANVQPDARPDLSDARPATDEDLAPRADMSTPDVHAIADIGPTDVVADAADSDADADASDGLSSELPFPPEPGVELLWQIQGQPGQAWSAPALGFNGDIYVGKLSHDSEGRVLEGTVRLLRLSPAGEPSGTVGLPVATFLDPIVVRPDGTILAVASAYDFDIATTCGSLTIRAYTPSLEHVWTYTDTSPLRATVAVRSDNVVMVRVGARLIALSPDGAKLWSKSLGGAEECSWDDAPIDAAVIVGPGDISYTYGYGDVVYAFSPEGEELWHLASETTGFNKRLVPTEGGRIFIPGAPMPVISLGGDLLNLLPKGGTHYNGLSGVGEMVIVTGSGLAAGYTTTEKIWVLPAPTVDSPIGLRTTLGLIIAAGSGLDMDVVKYTHDTLRVIDPKTGAIVAKHFGNENGSFALNLRGGVLLDDGTVIARAGIVGDFSLYAIRFPYGGLADTGWPAIYGDNQHSNRFRLAAPKPD